MTTLFDLINSIEQQQNQYYKQFYGRCGSGAATQQQCKSTTATGAEVKRINILPNLDITETNENVTFEVELAGVSKNDIDIEIKDSKLIIQGEKKKKSSIVVAPSSPVVVVSTLEQQQQSKNESEPSIEEFEDDVKPKTTTTTINNNNNNTTPTPLPKVEESLQTKKYISERTFGNFKRYIDLTRILHTLDLNSIKTEFNDGLLTITISKKQDYSSNFKITLN